MEDGGVQRWADGSLQLLGSSNARVLQQTRDTAHDDGQVLQTLMRRDGLVNNAVRSLALDQQGDAVSISAAWL
jgi:hypothetical protein